VVAVYLILISLGVALIVSINQLATLLPTYQQQFDSLGNDVKDWLGGVGIDQQQIQAAVQKISLGQVGGLLEGFLSGLLSSASNLLFVLALLLFMGADAAQFSSRLRVASTQRPMVIDALRTFAHGTRQYLTVTTVFGLIVAVIDTLILWALGIPLPVLWGLVSFMTNYIPNIGFVIGVVPPALLGLLAGGPGLMLTVIVVYCAINFVIQSIIQPRFVGNAVNLSTTLTLVSLVFWTWVLGALGALLAIPLTLLAKGLLIDIDPATRWINALISSGPVLETPVRRQPGVQPAPAPTDQEATPTPVQPESTPA
jgi:predicted PurR-regulated permease PerM